jgi:hypothetical protein
VSEREDDLELRALERQLDDAFETTRPRPGFEDELWLRMQTRRPFLTRAREAVGALVQGIREVPAVPMAGVAALVVVVIGVGIFAYSGVHFGGSSGSATSAGGASSALNGQMSPGTYGKLPSPVFFPGTKGSSDANTPALAATPSNEYSGPAQLTWTGHLDLTITSAPVFEYREPSTNTADQFATALGAVLHGRPSGLLGSYEASDYTLQVRGTVQSPPQSPAYFIFSSPSMPPMDAAGASPADLASQFLAAHSLVPQWNYAVETEASGGTTKVHIERQFDAPGYGTAFLVDSQAQRYGMEVDLNGNRVVHVSGLLPVSLDAAAYPIITTDAAVRAAIATGTPVPVTSTPSPSVQLTQAELAYVLVAAGDHSFYEPVFLFSGTFQQNGTTYVKHVLVAAVDPSQRVP